MIYLLIFFVLEFLSVQSLAQLLHQAIETLNRDSKVAAGRVFFASDFRLHNHQYIDYFYDMFGFPRPKPMGSVFTFFVVTRVSQFLNWLTGGHQRSMFITMLAPNCVDHTLHSPIFDSAEVKRVFGFKPHSPQQVLDYIADACGKKRIVYQG